MADESSTDDSQKTEAPTPKKLEEARERGQVVNSREINNWVILFVATMVVVMGGPGIMSDMRDLFKNFLQQSFSVSTDAAGLGNLAQLLLLRIGGDILLPLILLSAAGAISGFMQTGPLFTLEPLRPDLSKISIAKGAARLFSRRSLMELGKGLLKLALISIAAVMALKPYMNNAEHFVGLDFSQALFELRTLFIRMMVAVLSVLFVLAIFDYIFQREEFMKTMRMSKQEIMDEQKQTEGDPHIKGKLRQLREQKARKRMMQAIPTADVVITNPTHYAVALKYNAKEMDAPTMIGKGVDAVAERIKEVAKEHNIPIVENPTLARALYGSMEIDQTIPRDHYKAVAEVISYVFKLKGRRT